MVGNQSVKREATCFNKIAHRFRVRFCKFRRNANARFAHEGGREGEAEGRLVETGEDDLASRCQAGDQVIEAGGVPADIRDRRVVAARIRVGRSPGSPLTRNRQRRLG